MFCVREFVFAFRVDSFWWNNAKKKNGRELADCILEFVDNHADVLFDKTCESKVEYERPSYKTYKNTEKHVRIVKRREIMSDKNTQQLTTQTNTTKRLTFNVDLYNAKRGQQISH